MSTPTPPRTGTAIEKLINEALNNCYGLRDLAKAAKAELDDPSNTLNIAVQAHWEDQSEIAMLTKATADLQAQCAAMREALEYARSMTSYPAAHKKIDAALSTQAGADLLEKLEKLQAGNEAMVKADPRQLWNLAACELKAENDQLKARLSELEADKKRLDIWINKIKQYVPYPVVLLYPDAGDWVFEVNNQKFVGKTPRQAIDAALARDQKEHE